MKENTIKIMRIKVGQEPVVAEIENTLESLQSEVGGLIQLVYLAPECIAVINEEGKLNGSQPNRWLGDNDIICGNFIICGDDGEDFKSLNETQIEVCKEYFKEIPTFTGQ